MSSSAKKTYLGDYVDFQNGYAFKSSDYTDKGYYLIRIKNVQQGFIEINDECFVNIPSDAKFEKFKLKNGDIVVSLTGNVGRIARIKDVHLPAVLNQRVASVAPKSEKVLSPEYLYYLLRTPEFLEFAIGSGKGAAQQNISTSDMEKYQVSIPSLEKQAEIVEKLDSAFAEIDLLQVNLFDRESVIAEITAEKLDQIFRKKTEGASNSQQVALSEIARVINGRAYNQPELLKQGKYPVLRVGNFFSDRSWYYSDLELDKDKYCENGDLLYAWSASFGPRIWDGDKVIYHYHIWKVEEKKEMVLRDWLYWWFLWDVKQIKEAHGTGSTMMHVTKGAMENRVVQLPSLEMQSQQVREIAELQLATQKIESNYNDLAKKLLELKNAVLTSSFEEAVA